MINISIISKTKDPLGEIITEIKELNSKIKQQSDSLAQDTAESMKNIIVSNKVRPQSDEPTALESAIQAEIFEGGWGVGDVEKLKKEAPAWAAVNFGSSHLVGKHLPKGVFDPGEPAPSQLFNRVGRWKKGQNYNGKQYSPLITKPIPAMNYIEKTIFWLSQKFEELRG